MMGRYFHPASDIFTLGRRLKTSGPFDTLVVELNLGEILFGVGDSGALRPQEPLSALYIQSEQDYLDSRHGELRGFYDIRGYFGISKEVAEKRMGTLPQMEVVFPSLTPRDLEKLKGYRGIKRVGEVEICSTNEVSFAEYRRNLDRLKAKAKAEGGHFVVVEDYTEDLDSPSMSFKGGVYIK